MDCLSKEEDIQQNGQYANKNRNFAKEKDRNEIVENKKNGSNITKGLSENEEDKWYIY